MDNILFLILGLVVGLVGGFPLWRSLFRQKQAEVDTRLQQEAEAEAQRIRAQAEGEARQVRAEAEQTRQEMTRRVQEAERRVQDVAERETQLAAQQAQFGMEREQIGLLRTQLDSERAQAKQEATQSRDMLAAERQETRREREELGREIERVNRRAEQLDARGEKLDALEERLEAGLRDLRGQESELVERTKQIDLKLYEVAGLSPEAAREQILGKLDAELEEEKAVRVKAMTERASMDARRTAAQIIAQAIQRSASETSAQLSVSVVPIPSDAMKGVSIYCLGSMCHLLPENRRQKLHTAYAIICRR